MANELLAALPRAAYKRLLPHLEATTLRVGQSLCRPPRSLRAAYFPTNSIVTLSYAVEDAAASATTWPVGHEGMVGISLVLGSPYRDGRADVQVGGLAFRLPVHALLAELRRAGAMQQLVLRYVSALLTEASQLGVCSHSHRIEQRLCRFLVGAFDRVSRDEVEITHEQIAVYLGVRRESITDAAARLGTARVIEYVPGRFKLISREKLEKRACACAAIIRRAFHAAFENRGPARRGGNRRRVASTDNLRGL